MSPTRSGGGITRWWRRASLVALAGASACGGIGMNGLLLPSGSDNGAGPDNAGGETMGDGSAAAEDAALDAAVQGTAPASTDATVPPATVPAQAASIDASLDGGGPGLDGPTPADAGAGVETDGDTPCDELVQCCARLAWASPVVTGCYLSGNDSTCTSTLANLRDSGLCP
jgi:hypothetical protein